MFLHFNLKVPNVSVFVHVSLSSKALVQPVVVSSYKVTVLSSSWCHIWYLSILRFRFHSSIFVPCKFLNHHHNAIIRKKLFADKLRLLGCCCCPSCIQHCFPPKQVFLAIHKIFVLPVMCSYYAWFLLLHVLASRSHHSMLA